MNGPSLNKILSDKDFIKSDFFPTNPPVIGDSEFKDYITQIYGLYSTRALSEMVFGPFELSGRIFSSIDTPDNLINFRLVDKRWNNNVMGVANPHWNLLIEAKDLPFLSAKADQINKQYPKKSGLSKFEILSKSLGGVLKNQSINLENLKECENQINHATKAMWSKLRPQLEWLLLIEFLPVLPELNATAHDIRMFLEQCDRLNKITRLDLSNLQLSVSPAELRLLTGLQSLSLSMNRLTHFEIPKECVGLRWLDLENNQLTHFDIPKECVGLKTLDLKSNQLTSFDIPKECVGLQTLYLRSNQLTHFEIPKRVCGITNA